jgi:RNA polymerase sigma-70 factor (ECF subfamily)
MIKNDDTELVKQGLEGDKLSVGLLVDKYQKPIFNIVYRMCHNLEDARDITQGVFIRAFQKLYTFNIEKKFFSWLCRIAINESLNFLKQQKKMVEIPVNMPLREEGPDHAIVNKEEREQIRQALMEIEPKYRILIILKHFQNFSYTKIAEIMNLPEKTIKSRLYSARQKLGQILVRNGMVKDD